MHHISSIRLRYFPFAGRAAPIRDALNIGKIAFVDDHIQWETFGERRAAGEFPFGGLPVLDVETTSGKVCSAQSNAILRFAGRLSNLYPVDDILKALKVDEALDVGEEINLLMDPSVQEQDAQKKMAMRKVLAEQTLPEWLNYLERLLINNGSTGFMVDETLTVADLKLFWIIDWLTSGILDGIPTNLIDSYDNVVAWRKNITEVRERLLKMAAKE
jgi:glutathione S-transferase